MEERQLPIEKTECTHAGQRGPYTDSEYIYEIHTTDGCEIPEEDLYPFLCDLMHKKSMQTWEEWRKNYGNAGNYFAGYYTCVKTNYGYYFKFVSPFTD